MSETLDTMLRTEKYEQQILNAILHPEGGRVVTVEIKDLISSGKDGVELAKRLVDNPEETIKEIEEEAIKRANVLGEPVEEIKITVRIRAKDWLPLTSLRQVGADNVNKLVAVEGVIVSASAKKPRIKEACFQCPCGNQIFTPQTEEKIRYPTEYCQSCRAKAWKLDATKSKLINSVELRIQEKAEEVPAGRMPTGLNVQVEGDDLTDAARPGDIVRITGILKTTSPNKTTTLEIHLLATDIDLQSPEVTLTIDQATENEIKKLAKDPFIHNRLANSLAPSVYGYDAVKEGIIHMIFGGVEKPLPDSTRRGEINTLLIGDAGIAKSLLLDATMKVVPRGIKSSGKGTSAAGLTAAVLKDKEGNMRLEAGVLVLADKGLAIIDELDKMREDDRIAMHEALEQHKISIAKAGIVATLNARAAVLGAANPRFGRYDPNRTPVENINMPPTLISRFDLVFIMRDVPDKVADEQMVDHIIEAYEQKPSKTIDPQTIRLYVAYAKKITPKLTPQAYQKLKEFYIQLRQNAEPGSISTTARQFEALVRITEAHARISLKTEADEEDALSAISLFKRAMEPIVLNPETGKWDAGRLLYGVTADQRDKISTILGIIMNMREASNEEIVQAAAEKNINKEDTKAIIRRLKEEGEIFLTSTGRWVKT